MPKRNIRGLRQAFDTTTMRVLERALAFFVLAQLLLVTPPRTVGAFRSPAPSHIGWRGHVGTALCGVPKTKSPSIGFDEATTTTERATMGSVTKESAAPSLQQQRQAQRVTEVPGCLEVQDCVVSFATVEAGHGQNMTLATESGDSAATVEEPRLSDLSLVLGLTFLVATLSALDRVAMSVAIIPMSSELGLTETAKGQISSVFSIGYGIGIIPAGLLVSSVSPRTVIAWGVALWSAATMATPIAASLLMLPASSSSSPDAVASTAAVLASAGVAPLLAVRAAMGAAESVVLPAVQRILVQWVRDPNHKSLAVAGVISGFHLGTICAYSVSPSVIDTFDWRGMFYIYGLAGLVWLVPWLGLTKDPPSSSSLSVDALGPKEGSGVIDVSSSSVAMTESAENSPSVIRESAEDSGNGASGSTAEEAIQTFRDAPWGAMLRSPGVIAMLLAHAANNWGLYNNLAWAPTFYTQQYGLNVRDSALLAVLPAIAGATGAVFAGTVADKIMEAGWADRTTVRKAFQGVALLGPAACLLALSSDIPETPIAAQLLLTGTVGLQAFNAAGYGAAAQEKAGERWAGLLYSLTSLPGVMVGSAAVYATGRILDYTGQDWSVVFGLTALINIAGAIPFLAFYDSKKEFD